MSTKVIEYANFNITFGEENNPMLMFFEDYIYEAFRDTTLKRETKGGLPTYSFLDVKLKLINDEYIMVGNFVKDSEHRVFSILNNDKIEEHSEIISTAPYSRFIVFLKNHRMILIKNETLSPDIRSFNSTVKTILNKYRYTENIKRENAGNERLPDAHVNIIGIPTRKNISEALRDIVKISQVKLSMFPLNNDNNPSFLAKVAESKMKELGSNTGNFVFNSPKNKQAIEDLADESKGLAKIKITGETKDKEKRIIDEEKINAKTYYNIDGNIDEKYDFEFIKQANDSDVSMPTSDENYKGYQKYIDVIKRLFDQQQRR